MVSPSDAERLRQAQEGIRRLIVRDLTAFFGSLNLARPEAARDSLLEYMPLLVAQYGESAAAVAADWFDEQRALAGVAGRFRAEMVVPDESDAVEATVRRAAGALFTDAPREALASLAPTAAKYALSAARSTIARSADRDPRASGWQRVTRAGACRFCQMLHGRGAVYKESTVHFAAHKTCNCAAVPSWDHSAPEVDVSVYEASKRTTAMTPEQREQHNARIELAMQQHAPN